MANLPDDSVSSSGHGQDSFGLKPSATIEKPCRYRMTWEQTLQDYEDGLITPRGLIYYSVATRTRRLKINVATYCKELKLHRATYYRSLGALTARKRLNADAPGGMILSMPDAENEDQEPESFTTSALSLSCDTHSHDSDTHSHDSDTHSHDSDTPKMKPAQGASFKNAKCTNRDLKNLKETIGTSTVAPSSLNSDELGTRLDPSNPYEAEIKELLLLATQAGIKTNGTHSRTIAALRLQRSAAETRLAVEKSISAVVEQMRQGKCKNPGAMFNKSLQRELHGQGFTANEAKRAAKNGAVVKQPSLNEASFTVGKALEQGDRTTALNYLQKLWDSGCHDLVEHMLHLFKREWGFQLTVEGVTDGRT